MNTMEKRNVVAVRAQEVLSTTSSALEGLWDEIMLLEEQCAAEEVIQDKHSVVEKLERVAMTYNDILNKIDISEEAIHLKYLAEVFNCRPDTEGNMPCDNGTLCDRCCIGTKVESHAFRATNKKRVDLIVELLYDLWLL